MSVSSLRIRESGSQAQPGRFGGVCRVAAVFVLIFIAAPSQGNPTSGFRCATAAHQASVEFAGRPIASGPSGGAAAVIIFAQFADEHLSPTPPDWAAQLLDPDVAGSVAHFYDTMSFGAYRIRGDVAPRRYTSAAPTATYLAHNAGEAGGYGLFSLQILQQADDDIDFREYDNDGPDGRPDSGDDDGLVDALFINVATAPTGFILRQATGIANLGFDALFLTDDIGHSGLPISIDPAAGTFQRAPDEQGAAAAMAHEFGHLLGLPDLYDTAWISDPGEPEDDSAGIGRWGLMGWGTTGWAQTPGPNSLSAWSRFRLGWAQTLEPTTIEAPMRLEPVALTGQLARIPLSGNEYFLLEYRRRDAYYDRGIPGEGLLIWRVRRAQIDGETAFWWDIDLECADGRWADAGAPLGRVAAPHTGGDNLDFWAHDPDYTAAHGGNLGDATDPFDGIKYRRFAPGTNPPASSTDRTGGVTIEEISAAADHVSFFLRQRPPSVKLTNVTPQRPAVTAGTPMAVTFQLENLGGTPAENLQVRLHSPSEAIQFLPPQLDLFPIGAGGSTVGNAISPVGFPKVRFRDDLDRGTTATIELEIYVGNTQVASATTQVTGQPSHHLEVTLSAEGAPLPSIPVRVRPHLAQSEDLFYENHLISDSTGSVVFRLPTGRYSVAADPDMDSPWLYQEEQDLTVDGDRKLQIEMPRTYLLTGTVRDADGQPVSGHVLQASREAIDVYWSGSTQTNAVGQFSIRVPLGVLRIRSIAISTTPTYAGQDHGLVEISGDTELDVALDRGVTVDVNIIDADSVGIDGVRFYLFAVNSTSLSSGHATRDGGHSRFSLIPDDYSFSFSQIPLPYVNPSYEEVAIAADTTITIVLPRGVVLKGQLADTTGATILFASGYTNPGYIVLNGSQGSATVSLSSTTVADFETALLPGIYDVSVQLFSNPYLPDVGFPSQDLGTIQIEGDTTMTFTVHPGAVLDGRVIGDIPASDQQGLSFTSGSSAASTVFADLDPGGFFSVRLVPGDYAVYASFSGEDNAPPSQTLGNIHVRGDTTVQLRLRDDEIVRGQVVNVAGSPVPEIIVSTRLLEKAGYISNTTVTGEDGAFALRLPVGRHNVFAHQQEPGNNSIIWRLQDLDMPSLSPPLFRLPGGATFSLSPAAVNKPFTASHVALFPGTFHLGDYLRKSSTLLPSVEVRLETDSPLDVSVAPGDYFGIVSPLYGQTNGLYTRVHPRLTASGLDPLDASCIRAATDLVLSGQVSDGDGAPPENANLYFYGADIGLLAIEVVDRGHYEMELPAGTYHLALRNQTADGYDVAWERGPVVLQQDQILDIHFGDATAIGDAGFEPRRFALEQSYPNPFNADTVIEFSLDRSGPARMMIFDLLGQQVRALVNGEFAPGSYRVSWDGRDENNHSVASGLFFYRLTTPDQSATGKMLLLR